MGYKSLADFVTDAVREKCEQLKILTAASELPQLEHFNISENGVRILDRTLTNGVSRGCIIDVYFSPEGVLCEYCQTDDCKHVQFTLTIPKIREIVWKKRYRGRYKPRLHNVNTRQTGFQLYTAGSKLYRRHNKNLCRRCERL